MWQPIPRVARCALTLIVVTPDYLQGRRGDCCIARVAPTLWIIGCRLGGILMAYVLLVLGTTAVGTADPVI